MRELRLHQVAHGGAGAEWGAGAAWSTPPAQRGAHEKSGDDAGGCSIELGCAYDGDDPEHCFVDFYHPYAATADAGSAEAVAELPLCIYVHGGYWTVLSAAASGWFAPQLRAARR